MNIGGIGDIPILFDLLGEKEPARGYGEQSKRLGLSWRDFIWVHVVFVIIAHALRNTVSGFHVSSKAFIAKAHILTNLTLC